MIHARQAQPSATQAQPSASQNASSNQMLLNNLIHLLSGRFCKCKLSPKKNTHVGQLRMNSCHVLPGMIKSSFWPSTCLHCFFWRTWVCLLVLPTQEWSCALGPSAHSRPTSRPTKVGHRPDGSLACFCRLFLGLMFVDISLLCLSFTSLMREAFHFDGALFPDILLGCKWGDPSGPELCTSRRSLVDLLRCRM